jgi:hypothetical protein
MGKVCRQKPRRTPERRQSILHSLNNSKNVIIINNNDYYCEIAIFILPPWWQHMALPTAMTAIIMSH